MSLCALDGSQQTAFMHFAGYAGISIWYIWHPISAQAQNPIKFRANFQLGFNAVFYKDFIYTYYYSFMF